MKKYFRLSIFLKAVLLLVMLSAVAALINLANFDGSTFLIGFPSPTITIYLDKLTSPDFHVNLSSLALNLFLAYTLCWLIDHRKPKQ